MGAFFDNWKQCMNGSGLPVPSVEDANQALEFVHQLHDAWEAAGGDEEMTIGALVAAGALTGVDEATLEVLGLVAQVAVTVYVAACVACLASQALDYLKGRFASNNLPEFMVAALDNQGVSLVDVATA